MTWVGLNYFWEIILQWFRNQLDLSRSRVATTGCNDGMVVPNWCYNTIRLFRNYFLSPTVSWKQHTQTVACMRHSRRSIFISVMHPHTKITHTPASLAYPDALANLAFLSRCLSARQRVSATWAARQRCYSSSSTVAVRIASRFRSFFLVRWCHSCT